MAKECVAVAHVCLCLLPSYPVCIWVKLQKLKVHIQTKPHFYWDMEGQQLV